MHTCLSEILLVHFSAKISLDEEERAREREMVHYAVSPPSVRPSDLLSSIYLRGRAIRAVVSENLPLRKSERGL